MVLVKFKKEDGSEVTYKTKLKYYAQERFTFPVAFNTKIPSSQIPMYFRKLERHFGLSCLLLIGKCAKAYYPNKVILPKNNSSIGILCHELAHIHNYKKYNKSGHNKAHWKVMRRMILYCQSKNNWELKEIEKVQKNEIRN